VAGTLALTAGLPGAAARDGIAALLVLHAGTTPALGLATGLLAMVTAGGRDRRPPAGPVARGVTIRAARSRMRTCAAVCSSWRRSWPA
jgi:hypothetical protein